MDLIPNPGARVGKLRECVGGKVSFGFWGGLWVWHSRNLLWQQESSKAGFLGEGSGVLRLGLDFWEFPELLHPTKHQLEMGMEQEFHKIAGFQCWCAGMAAEWSSLWDLFPIL